MLPNGNWLIAWGELKQPAPIPYNRQLTISEVDPDDGTVFLHLHMSRNSAMVHTYRSYRVPEASVTVPLVLP